MVELYRKSRLAPSIDATTSRLTARRSTLATTATRRGVRLTQGNAVLSELLARPGPTHGPIDVIAAATVALTRGQRCGLLGFAAGGLLAPLRALGWRHRVEAVDRSRHGCRLFNRLAADWAGEVALAHDDAARWLRRRRGRFDVIIDDLSVQRGGEVVKPPLSLELLPELIQRRLHRQGVAIVNLLPQPEQSWPALVALVARPFDAALVVMHAKYENRVLLLGDALPPTRSVGAGLRRLLRRLRSRQAGAISLRTVRRDAR